MTPNMSHNLGKHCCSHCIYSCWPAKRQSSVWPCPNECCLRRFLICYHSHLTVSKNDFNSHNAWNSLTFTEHFLLTICFFTNLKTKQNASLIIFWVLHAYSVFLKMFYGYHSHNNVMSTCFLHAVLPCGLRSGTKCIFDNWGGKNV